MKIIVYSCNEAAILYPCGKRLAIWHSEGNVIDLVREMLSPLRTDISTEELVRISNELPEDTVVLEVA